VRISCLTFALVGPDVLAVPAVVRQPDPDGAEFLCRHVEEIRARTRDRRTYPARFDGEGSAQNLFRALLLGPEPDFATAADGLAKALIAQMDARTRRGLLVCLRAEDGADVYGGVLKLDVEEENVGYLRLLSDGQAELGTISDVLPKPGDLKKGALTVSSLPSQQVMVVDRMTYDAAYFPKAFGIKTTARPGVGASALLRALEQTSPEAIEAVASVLPNVPPGEVQDVITALRPKMPALPDEAWSAVIDELARLNPPVAYIDTSRPVTLKVVLGAITISGPLSEMLRLVRVTGESGHWTVSLASQTEPEWHYPQAGR
jgi:hypothetical protein